jgi:hypothetical protein
MQTPTRKGQKSHGRRGGWGKELCCLVREGEKPLMATPLVWAGRPSWADAPLRGGGARIWCTATLRRARFRYARAFRLAKDYRSRALVWFKHPFEGALNPRSFNPVVGGVRHSSSVSHCADRSAASHQANAPPRGKHRAPIHPFKASQRLSMMAETRARVGRAGDLGRGPRRGAHRQSKSLEKAKKATGDAVGRRAGAAEQWEELSLQLQLGGEPVGARPECGGGVEYRHRGGRASARRSRPGRVRGSD